MDSSQLNMISEVSVGFLSAEQREAVDDVKEDDPVDSDPWPEESCRGKWRYKDDNLGKCHYVKLSWSGTVYRRGKNVDEK